MSTEGKSFMQTEQQMENSEAETTCVVKGQKECRFGCSLVLSAKSSLLFQAQGRMEPPGSSVSGLAPCD